MKDCQFGVSPVNYSDSDSVEFATSYSIDEFHPLYPHSGNCRVVFSLASVLIGRNDPPIKPENWPKRPRQKRHRAETTRYRGRVNPEPYSPIRVVFRLWASRQRWRTLNLSLPEFYKLLLILTLILFLLDLLQLTIVGFMYV